MKITENAFAALQQSHAAEDLESLAQLFGATYDEKKFSTRFHEAMQAGLEEKKKQATELISKLKDIPEAVEAARMFQEIDELALTLSNIRDAAKESVEKVDNVECAFRMFIQAVDNVACGFEGIFMRLDQHEPNILCLANRKLEETAT